VRMDLQHVEDANRLSESAVKGRWMELHALLIEQVHSLDDAQLAYSCFLRTFSWIRGCMSWRPTCSGIRRKRSGGSSTGARGCGEIGNPGARSSGRAFAQCAVQGASPCPGVVITSD